jgi:hypothetical protein
MKNQLTGALLAVLTGVSGACNGIQRSQSEAAGYEQTARINDPWMVVDSGGGTGIIHSVNTEGIVAEGTMVSFWTKAEYTAVQTGPHGRYDTMLTEVEIDCNAKRWRPRTILTYHAGAPTKPPRDPSDDWLEMKPDSTLERLAGAYCYVPA